jgi:hypothetical protein
MIEVISKEPNDDTLRGLLIELGMTGLIDNVRTLTLLLVVFP